MYKGWATGSKVISVLFAGALRNAHRPAEGGDGPGGAVWSPSQPEVRRVSRRAPARAMSTELSSSFLALTARN